MSVARRIRGGTLAGACLLIAGLALPAPAAAVQFVDPAVQADLRFVDGYGFEDSARPRSTGDVDGDGHDDLLVAERIQYSLGTHIEHGEIFFGPLPGGGVDVLATDAESVDLVAPTTPTSDTFSGIWPARDVNGDGRADFAAVLGTTSHVAGVSVLLGRASRTSPQRGFDIPEATEVAPVGDVDGDGRADLAVTRRVPFDQPPRFYVVFGKASTEDVDLDALGAGGFEILAQADVFGALRLADAGDVDGDGFDDVLVGRTHVLLGRPGGAPADVSAPGAAWRLGRADVIRNSGAAGDVNGDGFDDVLVRDRSTSALVALGAAEPSAVRGFRITFARADGAVVLSRLGDLDGDGLGDVAVRDAVVYGKRDRATVSTAALSATRGFRVQASLIDFDLDRVPAFHILAVGDLTGSDRPDLMFGAYLVSAPPQGDCTVTGTPGGDTLVGTDGPDVICGLGGNDRIDGLGGGDLLIGGARADRISGGDGDDRVLGGESGDVLLGGDGDDRLGGVDGADRASGEAGHDRLSGGDDRDALDGGDGDDRADGGSGPDTLAGGTGGDLLFGSEDADRLGGDEGPDRLQGGSGADRLDGGADADHLEGAGFPTFVPDARNRLRGGPGGDELLAGAAGDRLEGGADADSLLGGLVLLGGDGDDDLRGDARGQRLYGEDGDDVLLGAGWEASNGGRDLLDGGAGDDQLVESRDDLGYTVTGPDPDRLLGGAGADEVTGGFGNDLVNGGAGDDRLRGGTGADRLLGGPDDDELDSAGDGTRDSDACGAGFDVVRFDVDLDDVARDCETLDP